MFAIGPRTIVIALFSLTMGLYSCNTSTTEEDSSAKEEHAETEAVKEPVKQIDVQGHRGTRGVLPENSLPGFIYALKQGVTTLELDVVISKDGQVVVSHEPWMNPDICHNVGEEEVNIYELTYAEIKTYDCGSKGNPDFERQRPVTTYKPRLTEVFTAVENEIREKGYKPVMYNIETKSTPDGDGKYHPAPEEFMQAVFNVIKAKGMVEKVTIQSFDPRTLRVMKELDPNVPLVLLVANDRGYRVNVDSLGFKPDVYSPKYTLVDDSLVQLAHADSVKIVPWTVNDTTEMLNLLNLGVDGIITDYPKEGMAVVAKYQNQ